MTTWGLTLSSFHRLNDRVPRVQPALADELLALRRPAGGEEAAPGQVLTGQVDDSERAIGQVTPARRGPAIPALGAHAGRQPCGLRRVAAQHYDLVTGRCQIACQSPPDETGAAGNNDPHEILPSALNQTDKV